MNDLVVERGPKAAPLNGIVSFLIRLSQPLIAVTLCIALAAAALAALPSTGEEQFSFSQSLRIIGQTVYERAILPSPPGMLSTSSSGATSAPISYRNWILTLQSATPLLLTGLAIAVAFRANVLNIGGQGQYVMGAIAAAAIGIHLPSTRPLIIIPLLLLGAMAAGALLASIAAALQQWRNVPAVLSTLLLNFVALEFLRYLLQGPMRARGEGGALLDPQTMELPEVARLPQYFSELAGRGLHLGFFIALVMAVLISFLLRKTTFGFRLRVVGQNPVAARFAGMNVGRVSFATLAISGSLAGLAGGVQLSGVAQYVLYPDVGTDGIGFAGIAVALLGRLSPLGVVFSAIFFGFLNTAFKALERSPLEIHSVAAQAVQGALVIAVLLVTSPRWRKMLSLSRRAA